MRRHPVLQSRLLLTTVTHHLIQDRTEVSFEWDNVEVKDELLVGGFEVSGSVQSVEENAAVPGVDFILYSAADLKDLPVKCSTDGVSGTSNHSRCCRRGLQR
jgi:hypothetical protein